jgi:hypothetical protein
MTLAIQPPKQFAHAKVVSSYQIDIRLAKFGSTSAPDALDGSHPTVSR